ncbi:hypothetical protein [Silvanigrella sp.]|jgi:hypothetical protein
MRSKFSARFFVAPFALFLALTMYISDASSEQFEAGPKKIRICTLDDC